MFLKSMGFLTLQSTSSKPVKCIQGPIFYVSNTSNSWCIHNRFLRKLHKRASANSLAVLETLLYVEGRLLILAPNIRQWKCFFCVLMCCTGSAVYLAGSHLKKSQKLDLKILHSKAHLLCLKQLKFIQIYSIHKAPDIFKFHSSKYHSRAGKKSKSSSL